MKKLLLTFLLLGSDADCSAYIPPMPVRRNPYRTGSYTEDLRPLFWAVPGTLGVRAFRDCYQQYAEVPFWRGSLNMGRAFARDGIAAPYNRHNRLRLDDAAEIALNSLFAVLLAPIVLGTGAVIKAGQGVADVLGRVTRLPAKEAAVLAGSAALAAYCLYELYQSASVGDEEETA